MSVFTLTNSVLVPVMMFLHYLHNERRPVSCSLGSLPQDEVTVRKNTILKEHHRLRSVFLCGRTLKAIATMMSLPQSQCYS